MHLLLFSHPFWKYLFTVNPKGCAYLLMISKNTQFTSVTRCPFAGWSLNKKLPPSLQSLYPRSIPWRELKLFSSWNTFFPFEHLPKGKSWNSLGDHSRYVYCLKKQHSQDIIVMHTFPGFSQWNAGECRQYYSWW